MSSLVGTKWCFKGNGEISSSSSSSYNINFISNSLNFNSLSIIKYKGGTDYDILINYYFSDTYENPYYMTWSNQAYRLITITGGTDADTTSPFYTWLTNNATQVPVVDLSGTSWVFKGDGSITFPSTNITYLINFKSSDFNFVALDLSSGYITYYDTYPSRGPVPPFYMNGVWVGQIYRTINFDIDAGTDATNSDLIVWLTNNATYQEPISSHTLTIDGTDYTIDDNTNLLINSTGLYNSTASTQVWTYSGDTKFLGFATSSGGAIVYDINDTITLTSDLTLYSVEQARMPLYTNGVRTDKYNNKVVNKIGDYFVARYEYSITTTVTNGNKTGATSILVGGTATITITADSGYELPDSITVSGASYTYNNGVISLSNPTGDVTISVVCESGYEVIIDGIRGLGEYIYVQINDDPTWYYAQMDNSGYGYGFDLSRTNIPNAYNVESPTELSYGTIGISGVSKIKIGTQNNPEYSNGPEYRQSTGGIQLSTGDFANLTFTSTGSSAPAYATSEITMTQNSRVFFEGDN